MNPSTGNAIKVWDPLVRIFHWTLVTAFAVAYFTDEDKVLFLHTWAGYLIMALIVIRFIWGFVGTTHARFADFLYSPAAVMSFLRDTAKGKARRYLGHNPAGGWMIVLLLVMLALISISGLLLYGADQHAGPLAGLMRGVGKSGEELLEDLHEFFVNVTLVLVLVHVGGVMVEGILHKENLVKAMVTGYKRREPAAAGDHTAAGRSAYLGGLAVLAAGSLMVVAISSSPAAWAGSSDISEMDMTGLLPLEKVIDRAKALHPGRILEAEVKMLNKQPAYEVEMLDARGKVWEMHFNARTGELLEQEVKHDESSGH